MGSSYYARAVIGVKASKYADSKRVTYQVQKSIREGYGSNEKVQKVFDSDGKPVMTERRAEYIEFLGKNFMSEYQRGTKREIGGIQLEEKDFAEYLEDNELQWFSYDYNCVYDGDIIGMKVTQDNSHGGDQEGVAQDKLPELFAEAKKRLEKLGITEEPKLYASFYHSY